MTARLHPVFRYHDARAAIDWLCRAYSFTAAAVYDGPGTTVAHAELTLGPDTIGVSSAGPSDAANIWTSVRQGIYVRVADPDAHHARASAAGARVAMALRDMEYGSRDYSAWDRDGHLWGFGTYAMTPHDGPPVIIPELRVASVSAAAGWLSDAFGFARGGADSSQDDAAHAALWLDDGIVMLSAGPDPEGTWRGLTQCTHVIVPDPDAHCVQSSAAGASIVRPPADTPWGARGYLAQDPEGFLWGFSTYRPSRR